MGISEPPLLVLWDKQIRERGSSLSVSNDGKTRIRNNNTNDIWLFLFCLKLKGIFVYLQGSKKESFFFLLLPRKGLEPFSVFVSDSSRK